MKSTIATLFPFIRPYLGWVLLAPAVMAMEVAIDLSLPGIVRSIIDDAIPSQDSGRVLNYAALMLLLTCLGCIAGIGCGLAAVRASQGFGEALRNVLYNRVQNLSFAELNKIDSGGIVTRLTSDVTQVQDMVQMILRGMIRAPLLLVGGLAMAIVTSPKLAVLFALLFPLIIAVIYFVINRTYPIYQQVQRRLDRLNAVLQENLAGVRVVKAFSRRAHEIQRFDVANAALAASNRLAGRFAVISMPFMTAMLNLGVVAALWYGGIEVSKSTMTVGQIVAFINYLVLSLHALTFFSMLLTQLSRAGASADRIAQFLTMPLESGPKVEPAPTHSTEELLELENVSFCYGVGQKALRRISFNVAPGETIAILGATGSGKSTLVQLLPRFYYPSRGHIFLEGRDLSTVSEEEIRKRIGIVFQETILFSGTIRENIQHGSPNASLDEIRRACHLACIDEFIMSLPDQYDTIVHQRGANFSGGQKQRLSLARTLLLDPDLLILDSATSAMDAETEAAILRNLESLRRDQAKILIVQRVRSAIHADRILILDEGSIVADGTHQQLLQSNSIYQDIYKLQNEEDLDVIR